MEINPDEKRAANPVATFIGFLFCIVSLLLLIAVVPMVVFAKDRLDMQGGIAGSVVVAVMFIAGLVFMLRESTPVPVLRLFYFTIGGTGVVGGLGLFGYALYRMSQGDRVNRKTLIVPLVIAGFGFGMCKRGGSLSSKTAAVAP